VGEQYQIEQLGLPKEGYDAFERNNRWALYSSLIRGIDSVRLIAFWNGKSDAQEDRDARLVRHMVDLMRDTGGVVEQINPEKLLKLQGGSKKTSKKKPAAKKAAARKAPTKKEITKKEK
jgi:hypothetical protein